jgi:transcriptional regulator with XRE-family HTH domain
MSREKPLRKTGHGTPSAIGAWLKRTRLKKKLSVPELASQSDISALAIYNIESGLRKRPQLKTLAKLESALGEIIPAKALENAKKDATITRVREWPSRPGVYVLYDISDRPIYVGRLDQQAVGSLQRYLRERSFATSCVNDSSQGLAGLQIGCNQLSDDEASYHGPDHIQVTDDIVSESSGDILEKRRYHSECLLIAGQSVRLSKTEAALLKCLHANLGRVVSYKRLCLVIRHSPEQDVTLRLLRQHLFAMKRRLMQCKSPYVLAVAHEQGYVLCESADK